MDTLAHGLWGGAAFGLCQKRWKQAFLAGVAPDLLSFGPFFLTHLGDIGERWAKGRHGPPDPSTIPAYVYHAYDVTHSLVVWAAVFAVLWAVSEYRSTGVSGSEQLQNDVTPLPRYPVTPLRSLMPLGAWALHILGDIPTHSSRFFATPYLWPFPTPFYEGTSWGNKTFMLSNYAALAAVYLVLALWMLKKRTARRAACLVLATGLTLVALPLAARTLDTCFSPLGHCDQVMTSWIASAEKSLDGAIYGLTDEKIARALVQAKLRGVKVRVVHDKTQAAGKRDVSDLLRSAGIPIRIQRGSKGGILHHKFLILDDRYVLTGSFNWTSNATQRNDENFVVLDDQAPRFKREFERLWNRSTR